MKSHILRIRKKVGKKIPKQHLHEINVHFKWKRTEGTNFYVQTTTTRDTIDWKTVECAFMMDSWFVYLSKGQNEEDIQVKKGKRERKKCAKRKNEYTHIDRQIQ